MRADAGIDRDYAHPCEVVARCCRGRDTAFDPVHRVWACLDCWAAQPILPRNRDRDEFAREFPAVARRIRLVV